MSNAVSAAVTSALAGLVAGRVHELVMPERTPYPCINHYCAGAAFEATVCGEASCAWWRWRLDVYALTSKETGQLVATIRQVMRGFVYPNRPAAEFVGYEPLMRVCRRTIDFTITEQQDVAGKAVPVPLVSNRGPAVPAILSR